MKYTEITDKFTESFFKLADASHNVAITAHFSPDGDSISSVLSLYRIMTDRYPDKEVRVVYSGTVDEHFSYFENFEKIQWAEDMSTLVDGCDLLITLDNSKYSRFTNFPEKLVSIQNKICIDHHASEPDEFDLAIIVPESPSCSELIFRLFEKNIALDKNLAETFLLGIFSDTGDLTFLSPSQTETFAIVKKLVDMGVHVATLKSKYRSISKREFDLLQEFIRNSSFLEIPNWPAFQYTYARREFIEAGSYQSNEISAASKAFIAGYITSIKGYSWGFIVRPKSSFCGISMRSQPGGVNVRNVLERMSLGGGHDRSAGGIFKDEKDPKTCIDKVLEWLKNNEPVFT